MVFRGEDAHQAGRGVSVGSAAKLSTIMRELGHGRLTILKMDVETYEWPTLLKAIEEGVLERVDQLLFEAHFFPNSEQATREESWEGEARRRGGERGGGGVETT